MKRLLVLLFWLGSLLAMVFWLVTQVRVESDLSHFLPNDSQDETELLFTELQKGSASRLILLAIEGDETSALAESSQILAHKLRESGLFSRVENGGQIAQIIDPKLFEYRYLLTPIERHRFPDTEQLRDALQKRLAELRSPLPSPFNQTIDRDPTAAYRQLLTQWAPSLRPAIRAGVWFSEDGKRALLVAETVADGLDLNAQSEAVTLIEQGFQAIDPEHKQQLRVSGPGVFGAQSREIIRTDTTRLSVISSLVVLGLLLLAYRSLPLLLYLLLPVTTAFIAGATATAVVFGELHGITLAFGITLLGVTIDYPIHLFSHLRSGEAATRSVSRIWKPLSLGVVTTCIGYLVLVTTDFNGLRQLGVFTIGGLLAAALVTCWILPQLVPSKRMELPLQSVLRRLYSFRLSAGVQPALLLIAGIALLFVLNRGGDIWQNELASLSPLPSALPRLDRELRQQLKAPEINQMIIGTFNNSEQALQIAESLETGLLQQLIEDGFIESFDCASRYLPSARRQRERQALLPSKEEISASLNDAAQALPFRIAVFQPFLEAVENSRALPPITFADLADTPPGRRLAALLRQSEEKWILLIPLSGIKESGALAEKLATLLPPGVSYMDLKQQTERLVAGYRHGINERFLWGVLSMLLILVVGLRSFSRALKSLVPTAVALPITLMLLDLIGTQLTLFHLISLMLVVGIGLDYSLFFNHSTDSEESVATLYSLLVCFLSTLAVFAILGSSQIPVLQAIGQTVAVGVIIVFAAAYILRCRTDDETA